MLIYVLRLYLKKILRDKIEDKIEKATNYAKTLTSLIPKNKYTDLLSKIIKNL